MDDSIVKKFLELRDGLYLIADLDGYRIGINRQRGKGMCDGGMDIERMA